MTLSEHHDLRGGQPVWGERGPSVPASPLPGRCSIAIIGAGIMGAIVGERLTAQGHDVLFLDRRPPAFGSTAASTAEVMWAMDVPLRELAAQIGLDEATQRWRRVHASVDRLAERMDRLGLPRTERPTVYLAGNTLDENGLQEECALHRQAGLPTTYLTAEQTGRRFDIAPRASLVSMGGFEIDPVETTLGLLDLARKRGARICFPHDVIALEHESGGVRLLLADGVKIEAEQVIFAGGYERARLFLPEAFTLLSTFVIASPPMARPVWRERAMIWEASSPYLYIRSCKEGRIIAGGEDETFHDAAHRNALIGTKAGILSAKAATLLGLDEPLQIDRKWAATFGSSPDSLPAIGPVAHMPHVWLAAGFGGNGIAFAALAAELLTHAIEGHPDPDAACFDPYRFNSHHGEAA